MHCGLYVVNNVEILKIKWIVKLRIKIVVLYIGDYDGSSKSMVKLFNVRVS